MNNSSKASQTRLVVATSLFAAALISAMALTALGNQSDTYWVASKNLTPGAQISESDLAQVQVSLGESSSDYLAEDSSPIGTYVLHAIGKGELISINALSDTSREMRSEQVPISVRGSDIPSDIELGEAINIYWVPEAMGMQKVDEPALVISGAYLRSIDRKSANFGTDVALTVSVFSREIFALLSATSTGRLVVVRSNG
ncbi:unannotated protein [freshwater metagenome]|uniref:Unannotated protein n=1 Tax=freshwater metagenome TaxID=449393 RepID=A0A6J6MU40_9ZZZZ|nr:hypothetical protein [Actinomycetota bacterium]MSV70782.1 hypothetical protein [Actinomycetota bacterium]MSW13282.1 hypothetical protein [Actinomycetota bacterium]MSX47041.1 hypothetical protein [Actinomycetota bacterium]MSX90969.1 hypothetical protein [Actinomycetota bacterium]